MSVGAPRPWRPVTVYEREVICPGHCGYMAMETWREDSPNGSGICLKCGHMWSPEGVAPFFAPRPIPNSKEGEHGE